MTEARIKAFCQTYRGETKYVLGYDWNKHSFTFKIFLRTPDFKFNISHEIEKDNISSELTNYLKSLQLALDFIISNS